ncbi:MAG TPA: hypothetical protein VKX46_13615 [Ktedonobacteraceae bacterium]|nr:hypothetical protein [Ktedonobacteraceae bacterium]
MILYLSGKHAEIYLVVKSASDSFAMDERSRLRRSHTQDGVLSSDALRASLDNTRKMMAHAAGVSASVCDEDAVVHGFRHYHKKEKVADLCRSYLPLR